MPRPRLEVEDLSRRHGAAWGAANKAHLSLGQRRVMPAIEVCRTAALGGHVERCEDCAHTRIAYNSCRNRHCPKCQWPAAAAWLAAGEAELLPVAYFHIVFTLPAAISAIAYQNKPKVYGLLFTAAAAVLSAIAADPKHLGASIGVTAVLHTWGQNLQHHPHVHCIVPGGGLSPDGKRWIACKPSFFLPVRVLSRLFRRLFLQGLEAMHAAGELQFFTDLATLKDADQFRAYLAPLQKPNGSSMPKNPSPVLSRSWLISRATRIASRLLTAACSILTRPMSVSAGRTIGRAVVTRARSCAWTLASSCDASCSTCCRTVSIAFATTASSPTPIAPTSWRSVEAYSMCPLPRRIAMTMTVAQAVPTTSCLRVLVAEAA